MKWIPRLLALFIVLPAVELVLLFQFHRWTGLGATIALIITTGLVGGYLARRAGVGAWKRLQQRLVSGQLPGAELVDGVIVLVAGVLLVTPGLLSDVMGILGLLPPTRALLRRYAMRRLERGWRSGSVITNVGASFDPFQPPADGGWQGAARSAPRQAAGGSDR